MNDDLTQVFGEEGFDTDSVTNFVPPGKYPCLIEFAEIQENKARTGLLVKLILQILEGEHKHRKLFVYINIKNPSQQAVDIGLRTLASLGKALGLSAITNANQFQGQVVIAHVRVKEEQNQVNVFSSPATFSGEKQASVGPPPAVSQVATPAQQVPCEPWRTPPANEPPM